MIESVKNFLKKNYDKMITINHEEHIMSSILKSYINKNSKILEIGCGYGRVLKLISSNFENITGVDVNQKSIDNLKYQGYTVYNLDEFKKINEKYDVLILSHIIEHFNPNDLLKFLDNYLAYLKPNGYIIIATPLYTKYFYDDFDHIKPYQPIGLKMIFENKDSQVQYHSNFNLKMIDIYFRKSPFKITYNRYFFIKKDGIFSYYPYIINLLLSIIYKFSFKLISKTDGWIGIFKII